MKNVRNNTKLRVQLPTGVYIAPGRTVLVRNWEEIANTLEVRTLLAIGAVTVSSSANEPEPPESFTIRRTDSLVIFREGMSNTVTMDQLSAFLGGTVVMDTTAPVITSPLIVSTAENVATTINLTANETVTWSKLAGLDAASFTLTGSTLTLPAQDFETKNSFATQIRAVDAAGNAVTQTVTVNITNVLEGTRTPLTVLTATMAFDVAAGVRIFDLPALVEGESRSLNVSYLSFDANGDLVRNAMSGPGSSISARSVPVTITSSRAGESTTSTTMTLNIPAVSTSGVGIFGFAKPTTAPTTFPGTLMTGAEVDATDASKWARQNNDAALSIAPSNISASGAQTALRFVGYTDEDQVAANDRIAVIAKVENVSGGNVSISSNVAGSNTSTASPRLGWKQGTLLSSTALNPRISLAFAAGVAGSFSKLLGYNLTKLLAQKWFVVITAGQSNGVGATAVADPALDTPVEGCVVFPGATNTYTGSLVSTPMIAVDPVNHQTLNGSSSAYGGGPVGSFCRELRKSIPADYTIVVVAANYAGQGFKTNGLWNKTTNPATAYDGFWARVREAWAAAPAGSVMGGVLFCGGESDLGSGNEVEWASKTTGVPALFDEIRREPGFGQVPIVISEIGTPSTDTITQSMIALQRKLATGSGDALEYARCKYVPRPANAVLGADNVHFDQTTHRQRGIDMAQALASIVYPA